MAVKKGRGPAVRKKAAVKKASPRKKTAVMSKAMPKRGAKAAPKRGKALGRPKSKPGIKGGLGSTDNVTSALKAGKGRATPKRKKPAAPRGTAGRGGGIGGRPISPGMRDKLMKGGGGMWDNREMPPGGGRPRPKPGGRPTRPPGGPRKR